MKDLNDRVVDSFKEVEMPKGHSERFSQRLKAHNKERTRTRKIGRVIAFAGSIAASITILCTIFLVDDILPQSEELTAADIELRELIDYSDSRLFTLKESILAQAAVKLDDEQFADLQSELTTIIRDYEHLKHQRQYMQSDKFKWSLYQTSELSLSAMGYIESGLAMNY